MYANYRLNEEQGIRMNRRSLPLGAFFITVFIAACFWGASAQGRIVKIVVPEGSRVEDDALFLWWPELPAIEWWQQDREASIARGANVLVPLGADVDAAESLITARAVEKRLTLCFNLSEFIFYQKRVLLEENDEAIEFIEESTVTTGDGRKLLGFLLVSQKTGAFEQKHICVPCITINFCLADTGKTGSSCV